MADPTQTPATPSDSADAAFDTLLAKFKAQFPDIPMVTIDKDFGGWAKAQKTFFDDGGVFDRITAKK